MSYVICIPSYQREEILKSKTLKLLHEYKIPSEYIHIFVASNDEAIKYQSVIEKHLYHKIIIGESGIKNQRNFIRQYFSENTNIVSIDDDIESFYKLIIHDNTRKELKFLPNLHSFIINAFYQCRKMNKYIWGIYPVKNTFYMSDTITYDLKFIIGTFHGYINRHDKDLLLSLEEKEDYELSMKHFLKDNGVIRFNDICIKTRFYNKGGLGPATQKRYESNEKCALLLKDKYHQFGFIRKHKNGMTEFKFYPKKVYEAKLRQAMHLSS